MPDNPIKGAASKAGEATIGAARGVRRKVFEEARKRGVNWWDLPLPGQLAALALFREDLREFNLYDTEAPQNGGVAVTSNRRPIAPTTGRRPIPITRRWARPGPGSDATFRSRRRTPKSNRCSTRAPEWSPTGC